MAYLDSIIADDSGNFRTKLKRMDFEAIENRHSSIARALPDATLGLRQTLR